MVNNVHTNSQVHDHDTRAKNDFHIELTTSNIGAKITNSIAFKYWNSLTTDIKQIQSKNLFKKAVYKFLWQSEIT